jgi:hypothetical protein
MRKVKLGKRQMTEIQRDSSQRGCLYFKWSTCVGADRTLRLRASYINERHQSTGIAVCTGSDVLARIGRVGIRLHFMKSERAFGKTITLGAYSKLYFGLREMP